PNQNITQIAFLIAAEPLSLGRPLSSPPAKFQRRSHSFQPQMQIPPCSPENPRSFPRCSPVPAPRSQTLGLEQDPRDIQAGKSLLDHPVRAVPALSPARSSGCHPQGFLGHPQGFFGHPQGFLGHPQGFFGHPQGFLGHPQGFLGHLQGFFGHLQGYFGHLQGWALQPPPRAASAKARPPFHGELLLVPSLRQRGCGVPVLRALRLLSSSEVGSQLVVGLELARIAPSRSSAASEPCPAL
uniref:Uncharacterized protein n=1 Tax=Cyanistes caeruleus TaxID=156563 RepID=A0A8C0UAG3_CYACU